MEGVCGDAIRALDESNSARSYWRFYFDEEGTDWFFEAVDAGGEESCGCLAYRAGRCDADGLGMAGAKGTAARAHDAMPSWWTPLKVVYLAGILTGLVFARWVILESLDARTGVSDDSRMYGFAFVVLATVVLVFATGFYRQWLFWQDAPPETSALRMIVGTGAALLVLVEAFAALTFALHQRSWVDITERPPPLAEQIVSGVAAEIDRADPSGFATNSGGGTWGPYYTDAYVAFEKHYVWHFLDAVPALEIPETLGWTLEYDVTSSVSGALLLLFKILVILPIIRLGLELWKRRPGGRGQDVASGATTTNRERAD